MLCEKTLERMLGQASERSNVGKEVGLQKLLQMVTAAMKLKDACSLEEKLLTNLDSVLKSKEITLPTKVRMVKTVVFFSSHVWL